MLQGFMGGLQMRRKGFTIIEMLIVIAIIAVLVGIGLPRLRSMQMEGDYAKAAGELRTLQAGAESYYIHNSRAYPNQATAVDTTWQSNLTGATPQIIGAVLNDPFNPGVEYQWATSASSNSEYYVIFSVGPDRTADITGVSTAGAIVGGPDDDIYVSNGQSATSGF
jgi:prepilin-type N-terminal cleavage/methylation domain-containing protein